MTRSKKTKPSTSSVGETLVSQYADRLAVRQARDGIDKAAQDAARFGVGVLGPDGKHVPVEEVFVSGRQTSPELASLASEYMTHDDPNVRRLAASVLSQANEE